MEQPKQKTVTGFSLFKSANTLVATPKSLDDLIKYIDFAKQRNFKIAIQGGGNSYSDVFFNDQLVIDTSHLNSIKSLSISDSLKLLFLRRLFIFSIFR